MRLAQYLSRRYAICCPACNSELYIYSTYSSNEFAVKCNSCNSGYILKRDRKSLTPSTTTEKIEDQWKHDEFYKHYKGVPTSQVFMPSWMRKFLD